jgi:hypothetical protein
MGRKEWRESTAADFGQIYCCSGGKNIVLRIFSKGFIIKRMLTEF